MSDEAKKDAPWPLTATLATGVCAGLALAIAIIGGELSSDLRRTERAYERLRESSETQLRELQLRHESARECCRQPGVGYAECIGAFGIGASK